MRTAFLFALGLLVTGCEKSPRDKLQGTWLGVGVEGLPPSQADKAEGWAKATRFEFAGNKVTVTIPAEPPRQGTFKVAKAEGEALTVLFKPTGPDGGHEDTADFRMSKDGKLRWSVGRGEVVLARAMD